MGPKASVVASVDDVRRELERLKGDEGIRQPIVSRKLRTLMHAAGYKVMTSHLRRDLVTSMKLVGLHASPDLSDPNAGQGHSSRSDFSPFRRRHSSLPRRPILHASSKHRSGWAACRG